MFEKHTDWHYELPFKKPMNQLLYIRICCLQRKGQDLSGEGMSMSKHSRRQENQTCPRIYKHLLAVGNSGQINACYPTTHGKANCFVLSTSLSVLSCGVGWGFCWSELYGAKVFNSLGFRFSWQCKVVVLFTLWLFFIHENHLSIKMKQELSKKKKENCLNSLQFLFWKMSSSLQKCCHFYCIGIFSLPINQYGRGDSVDYSMGIYNIIGILI